MSEDTRFCYGVNCTWFGPIQEVSNTQDHPFWKAQPKRTIKVGDRELDTSKFRTPCCPNCGGMLMEKENSTEFWKGSEEWDKTHPGYLDMMRWQRAFKPICFRSMEQLKTTYDNRDRDPRFRLRHG
jgi:hypothetical protein